MSPPLFPWWQQATSQAKRDEKEERKSTKNKQDIRLPFSLVLYKNKKVL
jgi:hypothetical protein